MKLRYILACLAMFFSFAGKDVRQIKYTLGSKTVIQQAFLPRQVNRHAGSPQDFYH